MFDDSHFLFSKASSTVDSTIDKVTTCLSMLHTQSTTAMSSEPVASVLEHSLPQRSGSVSRQHCNDAVMATSPLSKNSDSSSTLVLTTVVVDPPRPMGNTHSMVTCTKVCVYKPKVFSTKLQE